MGTLKTKAQSLLTEKNNKIIPENIKEGIRIYNVTGTFAGSGKVNIYTQTEEPTDKNGLWFKTNTISSPIIIEDEHVYASEEWDTDKTSDIQMMPSTSGLYGAAVYLNNEVYLFGFLYNGHGTLVYKYNVLTNTYTKLSDLPTNARNCQAALVGTDIYLFGGNKCTKYDTLTDTYTSLADAPYYSFNAQRGQALTIGTDIYLLGGYSGEYASQNYNYAYKYDTINNTYTKLVNLPYYFAEGSAVVIGTDIYLFGGYGYNGNGYNRTYKYNHLSGESTRLIDIPFQFNNGSAVVVDSDILLFGGGQSGTNKYTYKYNIASNTYTKLSDTIYTYTSAYRQGAVIIEQSIYLFGSGSNGNQVQVMIIKPKTYANNSVVIANNKTNNYKTELISTNVTNGLKYNFNNFWYATTENNETTFDTTIEKYYGNGTSWVQIS